MRPDSLTLLAITAGTIVAIVAALQAIPPLDRDCSPEALEYASEAQAQFCPFMLQAQVAE